MEFDRELYRRAFSRVKASPEMLRNLPEVTDMTEKKRPWLGRKLLIAAVITALMALAALGANAAMGGEAFSRVIGFSPAHTEAAPGQNYMVRMENGFGKTVEFLAKRLEYDPKAGVLTVWMDTPEGEEVRLGLTVGKNMKAYSSFEEMDADRPITGTTEDGQEFSVEKRP